MPDDVDKETERLDKEDAKLWRALADLQREVGSLGMLVARHLGVPPQTDKGTRWVRGLSVAATILTALGVFLTPIIVVFLK